MKIFIRVVLLGLLLIASVQAWAQKEVKKDTIYYLIDTAKVPIKDRMFLTGQEGNFYGYRLTCKCYPYQTDAFFTYLRSRKGTEVTKDDLRLLNTINLRELIRIVVQHGLDQVNKTIFFFIELNGQKFIQHQVFLSEPKMPSSGY